MTFKEKLEKITAKELLLVMVESLRNPVTEIDQGSFGYIKDGICFGCTALNTICKIGGYNTDDLIKNVVYVNSLSREKLTLYNFVKYFEDAIDDLRRGNVKRYNQTAIEYGFPIIKNPNNIELPRLNNNYTEEELKVYERLANDQ